MIPHVGRITSSFGVAELHASDDEEELIKRADTALYKAKKNGRNRVEVSFFTESMPKTTPNMSLATN